MRIFLRKKEYMCTLEFWYESIGNHGANTPWINGCGLLGGKWWLIKTSIDKDQSIS